MTDEEKYKIGQGIIKAVVEECQELGFDERLEELGRRLREVAGEEEIGPYVCPVSRVSVEDFGIKAEAVPERAFPDSFYYKAPVVEELPPAVWMPPLPQMPYRIESYVPPALAPETFSGKPSDRCRCGHTWMEHAPACVHYIQGCYCEAYHPVNAGAIEGS